MSGPIYGDLRVSNSTVLKHVGVSIKWSSDSKYLAAPVLEPKRQEFRIILIDIGSSETRYVSGSYGPVAIKEFTKGTLTLLNSDNSEVSVDISKIKW